MSTLRIPVSEHDHSQGPADAPVTMVEYADYQCPYCGEAFPVLQQVKQEFGDNLRLVFRNFPLTDMHPEAMPAAVTAEYAATAGKFWQVHDALYSNQDQLGKDLYETLLQEMGLDTAGPHGAQRRHIEERIENDLAGGLRSGVNGTPAFFINGTLYNVRGGFEDLANPIAELIRGTRT